MRVNSRGWHIFKCPVNLSLVPHRPAAWRRKTSVHPAHPALLSWLWLLCLIPAYAQDALLNAFSPTDSASAKANLASALPTALVSDRYLGPVRFTVGAFAGLSYDDNTDLAQRSPEPDVIARVGSSLNFDWLATDHSDLQLGADIGYLHYQKYSYYSGLDISPDSALSYALTLDDVVLTLFDQLYYSRQVRTEAAIANEATLPQLNNSAGFQAAWNPGHWALLASYSHGNFVANHANDYLNRSSENFVARAGWRFAQATQIGVEASDALTAYQVAVQNNDQNISVGGFVDWQVRPFFRLSLHGGPVFYQAQSGSTGGSPSLGSYYVTLDASHQITDYVSHQLSIKRSLQAGVNQGGGYYEQLTVNYNLSWSLTRRISLGPTVTYEDGRQTLEQAFTIFSQTFLIPQNESYQRYGGGLQATWHATDHLTAALNFNHWLRHSDLPNRGYSDNLVSLQFTYTF